jgi:hypothetical protein
MDFESIEFANFSTPARNASVRVVRGIRDIWGEAGLGLNGAHRRLFRLQDEIDSIDTEIDLVEAELGNLRAINDDAQRDAVVGNYIDREEAGLTAADVRRFERALDQLRAQRDKLSRKRNLLLTRLPD